MTRTALLLALAAALALATPRLWPVSPAWHQDPATLAKPAAPNHWLLRDGADAPALRVPLPPDAVATRLAQIAAATPRTRLIAGGGRHTTWLSRTRLLGFPDTTSVLIRPDGTGSEILLFARARLAGYDWGTSRARAEAWAAALSAP